MHKGQGFAGHCIGTREFHQRSWKHTAQRRNCDIGGWNSSPLPQGRDSTLPSRPVYLHLSNMNFSDSPVNPRFHRCFAILSLRNIGGFRTLPATVGKLNLFRFDSRGY